MKSSNGSFCHKMPRCPNDIESDDQEFLIMRGLEGLINGAQSVAMICNNNYQIAAMRYGVGSKQSNDTLRAIDLQIDLLRRLAVEHEGIVFIVQSLHGMDNISRRRFISLNPLKPKNSTFNTDYSLVSETTRQKYKFRHITKAAAYVSQIIDEENECSEMSKQERLLSSYCDKFTYWIQGTTVVLVAYPQLAFSSYNTQLNSIDLELGWNHDPDRVYGYVSEHPSHSGEPICFIGGKQSKNSTLSMRWKIVTSLILFWIVEIAVPIFLVSTREFRRDLSHHQQQQQRQH